MKTAAYFDVDGTLTATTSVTPLLWYRHRRGTIADHVWAVSIPFRAPWWLLRYRLNNAAGNRTIYRNYRGFNAVRAQQDAHAFLEECLKPRLHPPIVDRLNVLKRDGVKIVLITGGLDFILRPLADYLEAELIAPGLVESGGTFTGVLTRAPLTGHAKFEEVRAHAQRNGIDLSASHAFGNEHGDAEMLQAVGHPVAVHPDRRLKKIALQHRWEIVEKC